MSDLGQVSSLQELVIADDYNSKKSLPDSLCCLNKLRILDLHGPGGYDTPGWESLPRRFGELQSLVILNLCGCENIGELPAGFQNLRCLQDINLGYCNKIVEKKETYIALGQILTLTRLSLEGCSIVALPEEIKGLASLEYFNLEGCEQLRDLSEGCPAS